MTYIDPNRRTLAEASVKAFREDGRGAWVLSLSDNIGPRQSLTYLTDISAAKAEGGPSGGWADSELKRIVNSYDPHSQFVVLIQEGGEWTVYECGFTSTLGSLN